MAPEVITALKGSLIVDFLALGVEDGIAHARGVDGEAHDAVTAVVDVKLQWLHFLHFGLALLLGFLLLVFLLLLVLLLSLLLLHVLVGFGEFQFLLAHAESVVGIEVEEHQVGIVLGTPTAMAAVSGTVALEEHRLATEHPLAVAVAVSAVGEVVNFLAVCLHQCDVGVVPAACADIAAEEPLAVGTPLKPDVAIRVRVVVLAIEHGAHVLRLQIQYSQCGTILIECHLLAVRTVGRILRCEVAVGECFLLYISAIGEVLVAGVLDFRLVDLPYAVALGGIDESPAVGREAHVALLLRRVGDALGGLVIDRCHIHVAVHHESHFLSTRREGDLGGSIGANLAHETRLGIVGGDGDVHLLRFGALLDGVDFAIIAVAEQAAL